MTNIYIPLFVMLFFPCLNYYYIRSNSMIYIINMESSTVSNDFVSLFPFYLSLTNSISPDYFIIGRAGKRYDSSIFTK